MWRQNVPKKEVLRFREGYQPKAPVAQGVKAGGLLFFSAIRGTDMETSVVPADLEVQVRNLFTQLEHKLRECGADFSSVVRVAVYMKDLNDRQVFNRYWQQAFGDEPPARFAVQVGDMGPPGDESRILLDVIALAPDAAQ
jgi:2-iminobutanoate/2-iminopropanoate deaminase